ncbi:hypothetical protein CSIM01_13236 [Colletotrichum simmondsii]|uniref:Uncharacterized protein n=1 Tax=Colletotrichum simmondsii TaxID=703756 RepID=A0A135STG3_9PEZI|nr:hypothetical protein CSIM01_13236 [Colletotrichum simmondsii]
MAPVLVATPKARSVVSASSSARKGKATIKSGRKAAVGAHGTRNGRGLRNFYLEVNENIREFNEDVRNQQRVNAVPIKQGPGASLS